MSYEGMRIIDTKEEIMDENSLNGAQNVGIGQNRSNNPAANDKIDDANGNAQNVPQYTIPGILHFIEHEWQRFQAERSQWDTDRAELQVSHVRGRPMNWVTHRLSIAIAPDEEKHRKKVFFSFLSRLLVVNILSLSKLLSRPFISLHLSRAS
jgi:Striatin family